MTHEEVMEILLEPEPRREQTGRRPLARWAPLLTGLLLGALLGTAGTVLASRLEQPAEPEVVVREWPTRVVPVEWRWAPQSVKYQHMFPRRR